MGGVTSRFKSLLVSTSPSHRAAPLSARVPAAPLSAAAAAMQKPTAAQLLPRLKAALQLQQRCNMQAPQRGFGAHAAAYVPTPRDRGSLMAALATLYQHEECEAREKLAREKAKKRKAATTAAAEASDDAAFQALFAESASDAAAAWGAADASGSVRANAAPATAAAAAASLPSECQVCYSEFNTEFEGVPTVRMRMSLCGHASICGECFRTYLQKRIEAADVMPFIACPEPGCKLPLSHFDIVGNMPTLEAAVAFEKESLRVKELAAKRDARAVERKHQRKLFAAQHRSDVILNVAGTSAAPADASSDECQSSTATTSAASDTDDAPAAAARKKGVAKKTKASAPRTRKASNAASSSNEDDDLEASMASLALAASVPVAPAHSTPPVPILTTPQLLSLVILHLSKALRQCRDFLPCGTHPLQEESHTDAPASAPSSESGVLVPASSSASSAPAAPAAASSASAALSSCPFGFVLTPTYGKLSKDKLKKCDHCGVLQCVKPRTSTDGKMDDSVAAMIAEGTLRKCPACEALQMKDHGMCNVMQCHACNIWWNWSTRATGKNPAALKEQARRTGSLWEPGELQYQLKLQREDLPAFKALLARNGIEYRENYIRGSG